MLTIIQGGVTVSPSAYGGIMFTLFISIRLLSTFVYICLKVGNSKYDGNAFYNIRESTNVETALFIVFTD